MVGEFRIFVNGSFHPLYITAVYSLPTPTTINPLAIPILLTPHHACSLFHISDHLFGRIIGPGNIWLLSKDAIAGLILG
jgi:hypothetical protein